MHFCRDLRTVDRFADCKGAIEIANAIFAAQEIDVAVTRLDRAAAISLVPLVLVAWADGKMDVKARVPIMKAAEQHGVASESPAAILLEYWLGKKPKPELASTWKRYVDAVIEKLSEDGRIALRTDIINGARAVAKATGGVLGFGRISGDEKRVIAELEVALKR